MSNILLNKPATASSFVAPYSASRAVDGTTGDPRNRWVSGQLPAWLMVDLQNNYWVNQWILNMMGSVGWPSNYNMSDFKLQGSLDNANWFDIDTVTNNSANQVNRSIANPRLVRFLRVNITKGLVVNNAVSSIVEFQASEPANAPFLSNLVPSTGALVPGFSSRNFNYTMSVPNTTSSITFTPTAVQAGMTIKVNGTAVASGQASPVITLNLGNNSVIIEVTSSDNTMKSTYTVNITRTGAASYLSALSIIEENLELPVNLNPSFSSSTLSYTSTVNGDYVSIKVTPTTLDASATIKVNNVVVPSGQPSGSINLVIGINTITIQVITSGGAITTYSVVITKTA